jgi:hypothetical protein
MAADSNAMADADLAANLRKPRQREGPVAIANRLSGVGVDDKRHCAINGGCLVENLQRSVYSLLGTPCCASVVSEKDRGMIASSRTSASTRTTSLLLWLACGLIGVVACSNQITYSRGDVTKPEGGTGAGGGLAAGAGGRGAGGTTGAGEGGAGVGGADAGSDAPAGTGGAGTGGMGTGGMGTGGMSTADAGMGGMGVGGAGMGGMGVGGAIVDNAQFNFEASAQGWAALGTWTGTARLTTQHFAGAASFGATLTYTPTASGVAQELSVTPAAGTGPVAGNTVTFHVFLPANASGVVAWVQPYVQDGSSPQAFLAAFTPAAMLTFGGWSTITLPLPATTVSPIFKIAVQLFTSGSAAFTGDIYVDSIGW